MIVSAAAFDINSKMELELEFPRYYYLQTQPIVPTESTVLVMRRATVTVSAKPQDFLL